MVYINNIVIIWYKTYGSQTYHSDCIANIKSLCSTPETDIKLYVKYVPIKKNK